MDTLEEIISRLKPNRKTITQLENYLLEKYHAQPMSLDKERLRFIEQEIILRHYTEMSKQKIPMDVRAYTFTLMNEAVCLGTFTLVLECITEEIYHLDFATAKGQTPGQADIKMIMKDLLLYLGLSQEDIDRRTPRFLHYLSTLCYYSENTIPITDATA